jgi:hypothetical protein
MSTILAQAVELLGVTVHRIRSMPEGQQLSHLSIHQSLGDVMTFEGLLEIIPSYSTPSLHRLKIIPPH